MGLTLVSSLLLAVFSWAKCNSYWENFSSAYVLDQIFVEIQDILKCQKHPCEFLLSWALQFHITLLGESTVRYKVAARPTGVLQATQQTSKNYSINLYVKGRKKKSNKTIKIDAFLSMVEASSNGLSEAHSGVEMCLLDLGDVHRTTGCYTNATREAVSKSPERKGKKNQLSRKKDLKKWW